MKLTKVLAACATLVVLAAGAALAADTVGVIEPQRILVSHPKFESVQARIKTIMANKQNEAKAGIEKAKDNQEKVKIFTQKKQEAAMEEQKLMAPIFKDINLAIRTVAKNKKCTVVVDKAATFFGGLDLTDDVIQEVKKVSAGSN